MTEILGTPDCAAYQDGYGRVCGVDEVGRGPLAGPVVAAAVVFPPGTSIDGLADSKKLSSSRRGRLVPEIHSRAQATALGVAEPDEIDRLNILQASLLAMARAVEQIHPAPDFLLVDGLHPVPLAFPQRTLVGGDGRSTAIAAASILAKQYRDSLMSEYAKRFPGYGFEAHKGYPTASHREALRRLGPSPIHRISFRGVLQSSPAGAQQELFGSQGSSG